MRRSFLRPIGLLALLIISQSPAFGSTVNDTGDAPDAIPGDGICATSASTCTLRAAVEEANAFPGEEWITPAQRS